MNSKEQMGWNLRQVKIRECIKRILISWSRQLTNKRTNKLYSIWRKGLWNQANKLSSKRQNNSSGEEMTELGLLLDRIDY